MTNAFPILNTRIATFLSVVFHPLIVTTYLFAVLFLITPDLVGVSALELPGLGSLLLLIFLNTFVAPTIIVYYFYRLGVISTLHADSLRERRLPYLACTVIYAIATYLFGWQLQPIAELAPQIALILGSVTVSMAVIALVNLTWKISAHATGMGGVIGIVISMLIRFDEQLLLTPLLLMVLISGFLLSARLYLNAHSPAQIIAGLACGLSISSVTVYFFF